MERTIKSLKREVKRNSEETISFRSKINYILQSVDEEVAYSIKRDLSVMTDMPFYKVEKRKVKISRKKDEMIKAYVILLKEIEDKEFALKLLKNLNRNQNQTIRKAAPKYGKKHEVWEHVIPTNVIIQGIIKVLNCEGEENFDKLLALYIKAGQRAISKEQDNKLKKYIDCMPENWQWKTDDVDIFARYNAVGIDCSNFK